MRVLHAITSPWPQGYSSSDVVAWMPGEVREVTAEQAAYLTSTFPAAFVEQHDPVPAPVRRGKKPAPAALPPEPEAFDPIVDATEPAEG